MNQHRFSVKIVSIHALLVMAIVCSSELKAQNLYEQYQTIAKSFGSDKKTPKLTIVNNDKIVAQYINGVEPSIQISKKAIAVCKSMKKDSSNALAVILSHELAHYYLNHADCSKYFAGNSIVLNNSSVLNEAEADRIGLIQTLKTGYSSTKIYQTLLDNIYTKFNLNENLKGYLSLEKRKEQAAQIALEAEDHYRIFIAANFLTTTKNYVPAFIIYDYLTAKYAFKENYNNAGVARLLSAIELLLENQPEKMPFILPVELDAFSRLSYSVERSGTATDNSKYSKQLLTEATDKFAKAILLDKKYAFAYLNMACANILLDNPDAALGNIKDLELNGVKNMDSYTVKAIAFYSKGDKKNAMSNFELAKKYNAANSDYNLKLMKSKDSFLNFLPDFSGFIDKYFGDKKPVLTLTNLQNETKQFGMQDIKLPAYDRSIQISSKPNIEVSYTETKNYDAIKITTPTNDYFLLKTTPYTLFKSAKGIKNGDATSTLIKTYQQPKLITAAGNFNYLQYDNIIFTENYKSVICDWMLYKEIKKTAN